MSSDITRLKFKPVSCRIQKDGRDGKWYFVVDLEDACSFSFPINEDTAKRDIDFIREYYPGLVIE